jgi:ribonuclease-3
MFPNDREGALAQRHVKLVCAEMVAEVARKLHLDEYILAKDKETIQSINVLSDVGEAVIGAIYLDQGWEAAKDYVVRQLMPLFAKVEQGGILKDYKTILQEVVYQEAQQTVSYELVSTSGPDHDKTFTFNVLITGKVMGTGTGRSKKEAEQKAARQALEKLTNKK